MSNKRAFTVSIGNYGTVVALHNGKHIEQKILVASLTDESKLELEKLFNHHKNCPIYILLDTADQNYRKKTYPSVRKYDLHHLIDRDMEKEIIDNSKILKNSISYKNKETKQWECVLIFSSYADETVDDWINFLLQIKNKIAGIYFLPVEISILSKMILNSSPVKNTSSKKPITFFIIQNKASGVRQIAFSDNVVIFTRLINYQFDDPKFIEEFEHDIFRTNEYLKRIFPELRIEDVNIINILPEDILKKISAIKTSQLSFINYTPYEAAVKIGFPNIIAPNSNFSDILASSVFVNSKEKTLRFTVPTIQRLDKLYLTIKLIIFSNIAAATAILALIINIFIYNYIVDSKISKIELTKSSSEELFKKAKSKAFDNEDDEKHSLSIDEIMDFGRINDILAKNNFNIFDMFKKLKLILNYGASVQSFSYNISNYDSIASTFAPKHTINVSGSIKTPSGDIEDLFKQYDGLSLATKNAFEGQEILYSELPKGMDFSKKYYNFKFDLIINSH